MGISSAQRQLDQFLSRYTDDVARQARKHLAGLRRRLPTAVQFVYDNYNALVIGFGQTDNGARTLIRLDAELVPVKPQPRRAHQGWRYLAGKDAPASWRIGPGVSHPRGGKVKWRSSTAKAARSQPPATS